jgi:Rrf2 family protein
MFRFNKDMEYALISLVEMTRQPEGGLLSARELSERYAIPYKLLARILQKLSSDGVVNAVKGPRGGYMLAEDAKVVRLGRIIRAVRGDERIADCLTDEGSCAQDDCGCTIKPIVRVFQDKWVKFVENTTLDEFARSELLTETR